MMGNESLKMIFEGIIPISRIMSVMKVIRSWKKFMSSAWRHSILKLILKKNENLTTNLPQKEKRNQFYS